MTKRYSNVFDALEDDPEVAKELQRKSKLMMAISTTLRTRPTIGIEYDDVTNILHGKIDAISIERLERIATHLNLEVK